LKHPICGCKHMHVRAHTTIQISHHQNDMYYQGKTIQSSTFK